MTGREHLNRRKRWLALAVLAGIVLALTAGAHAAAGGGVAAAVPAVAGQFGVLRCPWCRGNLGRLLMNAGWWRVAPKVRFCPYCGAELDDETDAPAGADPWDEPVE